jgi:hypothetical protein
MHLLLGIRYVCVAYAAGICSFSYASVERDFSLAMQARLL